MRTNTDDYVRAWGKKPRGRGVWFLRVFGRLEDGILPKEEIYCISGLLSEAKKEAARRMKRESSRVEEVVEIEVCP